MTSQTIKPVFGPKHKQYIREASGATITVAEGAVRAGKTIDNVYLFAKQLNDGTPDKFHLATGSTSANAKLNIATCNGYGLEYIFRGRCRWTKYRGNEALAIKIRGREYIVIFAGGGKADSFKKIRGNSYGMWIATEINLHHESMITEAFSRQLAARNRRIYWDLNPSAPGSWIYERYIDRFPEQFGDRYHYQHFTIRDNVTISRQRLEEIERQYEPGSIWYQRDILGERCIAEGLVYDKLAGAITRKDESIIIPRAEAQRMARSGEIMAITVGVDFGGAGSGHAFVASAVTAGYEKLIALESVWHKAENTDPEELARYFLRFVAEVLSRYGFITNIYCDSAEPVLRQGLKNALTRSGYGSIKLGNAAKMHITDRIFALTSLTAQDRFFYTEGCGTLTEAISTAVWSPKATELTRLDDGTSDIDTLDAFEYSFERNISKYIKTRTH